MKLLHPLFFVAAVAVAIAVTPVALASSPSPAELKALEIRGQALNQACLDPTQSREAFRALCTYTGSQTQPTRVEASSTGFDWRDFSIGAGAMFGLALLLGGTAAAVHYGRRSSVQPRTAS